jgi:hypothetical protein
VPARRTSILLVTLLAALLLGGWTLGLLLGWWDGESGGSRPATGPSTWQRAFDVAMDAVHRRDLPALREVLTARANGKVDDDLEAWQRMLNDPVQGPRILADVRERRGGNVPLEEIRRAREGPIEDVFDFFLRAAPRPAKPPQKGMKIDPADPRRVEVLYQDVVGNLRAVRIVRSQDGWLVDDLPL